MATTPNMPKAAADPLAAAKTANASLPPAVAGVGLLQQQKEIEELRKQIAQQNANQEKLLAALNAQQTAPVTVAAKTIVSKSKGKVTVASGDAGIRAEIARLQAENQALRESAKPVESPLSCRVSEKGAVSVYGLGHWPVTLYREQWERLLAYGSQISDFIRDNGSKLKTK